MMKHCNGGPSVSANTSIPVEDVVAKLGAINIDDQTVGPATEAGQATIQGEAMVQPEDQSAVGSTTENGVMAHDNNEDSYESVPGLMGDASDNSDDDWVSADEWHPDEPVGHAQNQSRHEEEGAGLPVDEGLAHGLPQIRTINGDLADLTTAANMFRTWDDYKLICLAGPKITLVFHTDGGLAELSCARKLLKDFSRLFNTMDSVILGDRFDTKGLFNGLLIKRIATTFIDLYELTLSAGQPIPVRTDFSFKALVDLFTVAEVLRMQQIQDRISAFIHAKFQEVSANWPTDFAVARMLQNSGAPEADRRNDVFPFLRVDPMHVQAGKLLDIQEAYQTLRGCQGTKVILPSHLAKLVSVACPAELRAHVEATGQLRPKFLTAIRIFDLKRRVQARRAVNVEHQY